MSKRSHDEFAEASEDRGSKPRKHPEILVSGTKSGALDHLLDNADDLIDCLQALKKRRPHEKVERRLVRLSTKLLPTFQTLAQSNAFGKSSDVGTASGQSRVRISVNW